MAQRSWKSWKTVDDEKFNLKFFLLLFYFFNFWSLKIICFEFVEIVVVMAVAIPLLYSHDFIPTQFYIYIQHMRD